MLVKGVRKGGVAENENQLLLYIRTYDSAVAKFGARKSPLAIGRVRVAAAEAGPAPRGYLLTK